MESTKRWWIWGVTLGHAVENIHMAWSNLSPQGTWTSRNGLDGDGTSLRSHWGVSHCELDSAN